MASHVLYESEALHLGHYLLKSGDCSQLHQQGNALCSEGRAPECMSQGLFKRSERLKMQESLLFYSILFYSIPKLLQFQTKCHHAPQLQLTRLYCWETDNSCEMGFLSCYHAML